MSAWLQQAALWSWQNSLAAAAMAVVVIGLRQVWRGRIAPRWLCLAGWLVMLRLFLPAPFSHPWAWDRAWAHEKAVLEDEPRIAPLTNAPVPEDAVSVSELRAEIAAVSSSLGGMRALGMGNQHPQVITAGAKLIARERALAGVVRATQSAAGMDWLAVAAWIWAGGAVAYFTYTIGCHAGFMRRLRRRAVALTTVARASSPEGLTIESSRLESRAAVEECAAVAGLRRVPALLTVPGSGSPFLCGLSRPQIILPEETLAVLTPAELRHVLLHEMLHITRRDLAANWLLAIVRALHWWNPLIHVAARRLLADREILRDDEAIALLRDPEERAAYGHTLLKLALPLAAPAPSPGLAPLFNSEKELKRRLIMIKSPVSRCRLSACTAAGTLAVLCAPLFTTVRGQEKSLSVDEPVLPPAASEPVSDPLLPPPDSGVGGVGQFRVLASVPWPASVKQDGNGGSGGMFHGVKYGSARGGLDLQPEADVSPGPLNNLRAVAARLREKGQPGEADAIEAELGKLAAPAAANESRALADTLPAASTNELQQLRAEMAEMRATLATLQIRSYPNNPARVIDIAEQELARASKAGYGPKHPRIAGLRETIRLTKQSLTEAKASPIAEAKPAAEATAPRAEAVENTNKSGDDLPWGVAVIGKKGMVYSPCSPESSIVNVSEQKKGDTVKCPYTGKLFRVP